MGPLGLAIAGPAVGAGIAAAGSLFSGRQSAEYAEQSYKKRYQWQVKDLKKAGLNPMLAVSQGPGSPPQPDFPDIGEAAGRGASAAAAVRLAAAQTEAAKEAAETTRAQGAKTIQETRAMEYANLITEASPLYQSAKATLGQHGEVTGPSAASNERWQAEIAQLKSQGEKLAAETANVRLANELQRGELTLQEIKVKFAPQLAGIEARYREAMAKAAEAGVPAAQAEAAFWADAGELGKLAAFIKSILR